MQSLQPTLRLGRDVWDREAMPDEEFRARAERLRVAMGHSGLDALLLYGSGLNESGYPTYVSNYATKLPLAALVVLPRLADPVLIFQGTPRGRAAAQATTWIADVRPCWDVASTCLTALHDRGLTASKIGLAGLPRLMPYAEWKTIAGGLGRAVFVDAESLVDGLRAVKSAREIAQVQRATRLLAEAWRRVVGVRLSNTTEAAVAAQVIHSVRAQGAEDLRIMIGRPGEATWTFRPPEHLALVEGEIVFVLLSASWERYWSEAVRTLRVRAGALERLRNDDLDARFRRLVDGARSGTAITTYVQSAERDLTPPELRVVKRYGLGSGIGVAPAEGPALSVATDATLAAGMCLAIRTAFEDQQHGLVMRGDTIEITS